MNHQKTLWIVTGLLALLAGIGIVINQRVTAQKEAESAARRSEIRAQMLQAQLVQQQAENRRAVLAVQAQAQRQSLAREAAQLQAAQQRNLQAIQRITVPQMTPPTNTVYPVQQRRLVAPPPVVRYVERPASDLESRVNELELREEQRQKAIRDLQERQRVREMMRNGGGSMPTGSFIDVGPTPRPPNYRGRGYTSPGAGMGAGVGGGNGRFIQRR